MLVQAVALAAFGAAWAYSGTKAVDAWRDRYYTKRIVAPVTRNEPLVMQPLYDRPDLVSDEELAAVLKQVQPRFERKHLKPNFVEHALRTWGVKAVFQNPEAISGAEMAEFLTDHGQFLLSWDDKAEKNLLEDKPGGIAVNYGKQAGESVHHDHWLACLTEAGVRLDTPVFGPARRNMTINHVLQEAMRDFRLDERETEWTALAFGLWLADTTHEWTGGDGRQYSFDQLARRLMRGQKELGVCSGTHRVYSLMSLVRLDDDYPQVLSDEVRQQVWHYLESVRDAITVSQFEDGHWPSNWPDGADAVAHPKADELKEEVIATGHHLEWLAIAPKELHPPEEQISRAMKWVIRTTIAQSKTDILGKYTFFSHIGNAVALWRHTHPADFWMQWEQQHPFEGEPTPAVLPQVEK